MLAKILRSDGSPSCGTAAAASQARLRAAGTDHPILQEIITHVSENAHQVHITELCAQIQPLLKDKLEIDMEVAQLEEHFIRHKCEQKIVRT